MPLSQQKILSWEQAQLARQAWKQNGEKVVFTNGCFDILHLGHVDYIEKARELGDRLILGLNSDASVSRLKGPSRPLVHEQDRARVMAALQSVDAVVLFGEDTPLQLIQRLLPDVLVKGGDYTVDTIVGASEVLDAGGAVQTIAFVEGRSTTTLVQKIQDLKQQ
ncbi:MAG TPA: D-glycero-beta-D-manno-heptose 1-phosphate adenylyltransferase [Cytophagales bacterium]|nr:D-glycero-beta-D-manno-heptose 1-phosphate adenylyltransferase [Cytophagales bacterium]HAA21715.1 D-glycero-beta-D-manno-heptose 1-phosphate adenylyltransferase [Cytophagales bacterium]HAP60577.1 D-glycero-beta-D-manno-heptose 1-phosphate adenylyltransferase [Cytophagales bacterium]